MINLDKAKSRDSYKLITDKIHTGNHSGSKKWSENLSLHEDR